MFDLYGNLVNSVGFNGSGPEEFYWPTYLAINDTHIFVVEKYNLRVQILDMNFVYADEFGQSGSLSGQFLSITGIAVNGTNIFVSDGTNNVIQIFDLAGNYVSNITDSIMTGPAGLRVNNTHIMVGNGYNVLIFDLAGNYISSILTTTPYADLAVSEEIIVRVNPTRDEVILYDYSGNVIYTIGGVQGSADGQFNVPVGIHISSPFIFVADQNNNRVQIFIYSAIRIKDHTTTITDTESIPGGTTTLTETVSVAGTVTNTVNTTNTVDVTSTVDTTNTFDVANTHVFYHDKIYHDF